MCELDVIAKIFTQCHKILFQEMLELSQKLVNSISVPLFDRASKKKILLKKVCLLNVFNDIETIYCLMI